MAGFLETFLKSSHKHKMQSFKSLCIGPTQMLIQPNASYQDMKPIRVVEPQPKVEEL